MAKLFIEDTSLTNIAKAIRSKANTTAKMTPAQMATAINQIPTGGASNPTQPEAPDGGWTYPNSPWKAYWYYHYSDEGINQDWLFDVSNCSKLKLTIVYNPPSSSTYALEVKYKGYYGYTSKLDNMGSASSSKLNFERTAKDSSTKYDSIYTTLFSRSSSSSETTITFDVSNYTSFVLVLCGLGYSSSYKGNAAIYVKSIEYVK